MPLFSPLPCARSRRLGFSIYLTPAHADSASLFIFARSCRLGFSIYLRPLTQTRFLFSWSAGCQPALFLEPPDLTGIFSGIASHPRDRDSFELRFTRPSRASPTLPKA